MAPSGQPQAFDEAIETWAVHKASQSAESLTHDQRRAMLMLAFIFFLFVNLYMTTAGFGTAQKQKFFVMVLFLFITLAWCIAFLFKIYEYIVWSEEVRFLRNGNVVVQLSWGTRMLNSNEGITLYKRRPGFCNQLGVWLNAVTDKTRDEVLVLEPSHGPVFWRGFSFQPEDVTAFLSDCRHAGIIIFDEQDAANIAAVGALSTCFNGTINPGNRSLQSDSLESRLLDGCGMRDSEMQDSTGSWMLKKKTGKKSSKRSERSVLFENSVQEDEIADHDSSSSGRNLMQEINNNNIIEA